MLIHDRRRCRVRSAQELRASLNPTQRIQLSQLELEGWRLCFVRQRPGQRPLAVLASRDQTHAELHADGRLTQARSLGLRDTQTLADAAA